MSSAPHDPIAVAHSAHALDAIAREVSRFAALAHRQYGPRRATVLVPDDGADAPRALAAANSFRVALRAVPALHPVAAFAARLCAAQTASGDGVVRALLWLEALLSEASRCAERGVSVQDVATEFARCLASAAGVLDTLGVSVADELAEFRGSGRLALPDDCRLVALTRSLLSPALGRDVAEGLAPLLTSAVVAHHAWHSASKAATIAPGPVELPVTVSSDDPTLLVRGAVIGFSDWLGCPSSCAPVRGSACVVQAPLDAGASLAARLRAAPGAAAQVRDSAQLVALLADERHRLCSALSRLGAECGVRLVVCLAPVDGACQRAAFDAGIDLAVASPAQASRASQSLGVLVAPSLLALLPPSAASSPTFAPPELLFCEAVRRAAPHRHGSGWRLALASPSRGAGVHLFVHAGSLGPSVLRQAVSDAARTLLALMDHRDGCRVLPGGLAPEAALVAALERDALGVPPHSNGALARRAFCDAVRSVMTRFLRRCGVPGAAAECHRLVDAAGSSALAVDASIGSLVRADAARCADSLPCWLAIVRNVGESLALLLRVDEFLRMGASAPAASLAPPTAHEPSSTRSPAPSRTLESRRALPQYRSGRSALSPLGARAWTAADRERVARSESRFYSVDAQAERDALAD